LQDELAFLEELNQFEVSRFLLKNKGLNGYWISYLILYGRQKDKSELTSLEKWFLYDAPVIKATQQRFRIFQEQLIKYINKETKVASIPCGTMDDLLSLNIPHDHYVHFCGIDLDKNSLELAEKNSKKYAYPHVSFHQRNAWNLGASQKFDLITSNGLNIYEPDDQKVVQLYQEFYKVLKSKGILIASFLTPPPNLSKDSLWKNYNKADVIKQKAIFGDIIQTKWQVFRTESQKRVQLEKTGFKVLDVIYETKHMFPTIIAQKRD